MENVSIHLARMEELFAEIDDTLEKCGKVPLSKKVAVDKETIYGLVDEIRGIMDDLTRDLPNEITQAKRIIAESEKYIADARIKAASILKSAESERLKMIDAHEITKAATEEGARIIAAETKESRDIRRNAMEYADEVVADVENKVRVAMEQFTQNMNETKVLFRDAEESFEETEQYLLETLDKLYENRKALRGIQ